MKRFSILLVCALFLAPSLYSETYKIDPDHSGVTFRVAHLVVSKVSGGFEKFEGSFVYEEGNPKAWKANAVIDANSINTKNEKRDTHLKSPDFLSLSDPV